MKAGMHELVDVGQLGIVFPNTPLSTTKSFIKSNRDTALRFLRGFSQGLNRLRTDKEFSMKVLSKYTKVMDSDTLAQLHQTYGVRYSGDRIPYVRAEGVDRHEDDVEASREPPPHPVGRARQRCDR